MGEKMNLKKYHDSIVKDPLYRNSLFLMMSSVVMTGFGFFFWTICSRLFSAHDIGMASTIISAMNLIVSISGLGLGMALIRFLPESKDKNKKINSCFAIVGLFSIIVSTVFLLGISFFSPELLFIKKNLYLSIAFILSVMFYGLFGLTESVFLSYGKAGFIVIKNLMFSVLKLVFPVLLVGFGSFGIFGSWGLSALISFIFSMVLLIKYFKYSFKLVIYDAIIKKVFSFSFGNYIAGFLSTMPSLVLPLLITNRLGAENTAYFYVSFMIAGLLFVIPSAVSSSLLVEGSKGKLRYNLNKAIKITSVLLIIGIGFVIFFGKYLLLLFGKEYVVGYSLLVVLAISSIFVAIKTIAISLLNVKKEVKKIVVLNLLTVIVVVPFGVLFMNYGLEAIGLVWLAGNFISCLGYFTMESLF